MTGAPLQLRPYQQRGIDLIRQSFGSGNRRVAYYCPTGGGKTVVAEEMIRAFVAKNPDRRVLLVANRKHLVQQASEHLTAAGIEHGILQGENTRRLGERVLVCSIDTIHVRGIPDDVGFIIIDECHAVAGNSKYKALLFKYNRVPVVGLTATPFSKGLGQHYDELRGRLFEKLVVGATIRELIDLDNLVDVDCYAPAEPDLSGVKTRRGIGGETDYVETDLAEAMDKPALVGDIVSHWQRLARGRPTVVFATNIAHSKHIVEAFRAAGVSAEHLDYHHDDDARKDILGRFGRGEFTVLSNSALLAEGWNCPTCEVMILARPTKSLIRYIQMVGRVLRPAPGKKRALLLDHSGSVLELGFATDDLPLVLDDGTPNKSAGNREGRKSEPSPCPRCKYVRPAGAHRCPQCDFAPERQSEIVAEDGELVKLERRTTAAHIGTKQSVYSQLLNIARSKQYQPGWVSHKFRAIFRVWPRGMKDVPAEPTPELRSWLQSQQIRHAKGREKAKAQRQGQQADIASIPLSREESAARLAALVAEFEREVAHG